jgi:hypothetical protein
LYFIVYHPSFKFFIKFAILLIYFGKVFFKILRLVPRTFLTTLKVLLVIFVNLGSEYSIIFGITH